MPFEAPIEEIKEKVIVAIDGVGQSLSPRLPNLTPRVWGQDWLIVFVEK